MTLVVNGVNMIPLVARGGIKWQRSDVDGQGAGRNLSGSMIRDRKAIKKRLDVTCKPLTTAQASTVLQAIEPEFVTVTYTDIMEGRDVTITMYSNNVPAQYLMHGNGNVDLWGGITFPLIER